MLLIPMWQPWASAVAVELKRVETRGQPQKYRGLVAIHACAKWDRETREALAGLPTVVRCQLAGSKPRADFPLGKIIAVANLAACLSADASLSLVHPKVEQVFRVYPTLDTPTERSLGNYGPGRYGWVFDNVRALKEPLAYKAHQGCYPLDSATEAEVMRRIA